MERGGGEIGQRLLELAEGDRRLIKVVAVARRLETEAAGDIIIGPPEFPLCVDGIFSAAPGCAEADHFQSGVLLCDKARNCVNILDQLLRVPECDAVDALETVSPELRSALMEKLDPESQHDIRLICSYQPDEIGSAMSTNFVSINRHLSVKQAMRALIAQAEENDNIYTLFVSDDDGSFYGAIALKDLIVAREDTALDSLISRHFPAVLAHEQIEACLDRLRSYAEASIPVLGEKRRVIGVITTDDIVEAVDDAMGDDYAKLGGLTGEEDLHEPLKTSLKKRLPWLIILLFLGMGVSSVVGLFESVVSQVALIVCFQSLILDMAAFSAA